MINTGLPITTINLTNLFNQHATIKAFVERCNGLWNITGTQEQIKFMMKCFHDNINEQPFDIIIINQTNTYGLVDPVKVQDLINKRQVRRWDQ